MDKSEFGRKVLARSKSKDKRNQKDTVNPPPATPTANHYLPPSEPIRIPPEHRFQSLLNFFESGHPDEPPSALASGRMDPRELLGGYALQSVMAGLPLLASPKHIRALLALKEIATKIMRSGIFYEGGLKGSQLSFNPETYESYPIQGLDQFVLTWQCHCIFTRLNRRISP
jgi:hypothetical protein